MGVFILFINQSVAPGQKSGMFYFWSKSTYPTLMVRNRKFYDAFFSLENSLFVLLMEHFQQNIEQFVHFIDYGLIL